MKFTDTDIRMLAQDVASEIDAVAWGLSTWDEVGRIVLEAFPGSLYFMFNEDPVTDVIRSFHFANVEERHVRDYADYYYKRDVWSASWRRKADRITAVSERDAPSSLLRNSEYYQDFLSKIDNFEAAVGVKAQVSADLTLRMPFHYSAKMAPLYDEPYERVLAGIHGSLQRWGVGLSQVQDRVDRQTATAAVLGRDGVAVVVDATLRVIDGNDAAASAFADGGFVKCVRGRLAFAHPDLTHRLQSVVTGLTARPDFPASAISFKAGQDHWSIRFARLPAMTLNTLMVGRPQILVEIRNLTEPARIMPAIEDLARTHGLTPAETELCRQLLRGLSVKEAAIASGLSHETVRTRLKAVFQKTGAHRQAELLLMLSQK